MPTDNYQTPDLYLAASFIAQGHKLLACVREGGRMYWTFADKTLMESLEVAFVNNTLMVPARTFADTVRRLKSGAVSASKGST
jgi:hypothetical protein